MNIPRHSTVIAYASLFVALGGTGYAATQLPTNSVGSAQIRNGSIQQRDLARGVVSKRNAKFSEAVTGVVTDPASGILNVVVSATDGAAGPAGPVGPQGADSATPGPQGGQGPTGPRGSALGFAHVAANGIIDAAHSTPNAVVTKAPATNGTYCIDATDSKVNNLYTTPDANDSLMVAIGVRVPPPGGACEGHDMQVIIVNLSGPNAGQAGDHAFYVTLN
jgi:hypothetical protein